MKTMMRNRPDRPRREEPGSSAALPRVAPMAFWLTGTRSTGRAPVCRTSARFCASSRVNLPVISACPPGISDLHARRRLDVAVEHDGQPLVLPRDLSGLGHLGR